MSGNAKGVRAVLCGALLALAPAVWGATGGQVANPLDPPPANASGVYLPMFGIEGFLGKDLRTLRLEAARAGGGPLSVTSLDGSQCSTSSPTRIRQFLREFLTDGCVDVTKGEVLGVGDPVRSTWANIFPGNATRNFVLPPGSSSRCVRIEMTGTIQISSYSPSLGADGVSLLCRIRQPGQSATWTSCPSTELFPFLTRSDLPGQPDSEIVSYAGAFKVDGLGSSVSSRRVEIDLAVASINGIPAQVCDVHVGVMH